MSEELVQDVDDIRDLELSVVDEDVTKFQMDCLRHVAYEGNSKGLSIKESLEREYGHPVNHSRLYPNLDEIVDMGLVRKGKIDNRTNSYRLTEAGLEVVAQYAQLWIEARESRPNTLV